MLDNASFVAFVPVSDLAVAREFYVSTLGLAVRDESPFALVVDAHGTDLRVTPVPELRPQPFTVAGWVVPDIEAEADALAACGVTFARYDGLDQDVRGIWTAPGGDRVAWFFDPDGNTLSLTSPAAR